MEKDIVKDVQKNPKRFWKYANSKRKTKSVISESKYKLGNKITSKGDKDKAEVLAEFFNSVFTIEPKEGPVIPLSCKFRKSGLPSFQFWESKVKIKGIHRSIQ